MQARTAMRAAWRVHCLASEERRGQSHCGYGSLHGLLNFRIICVLVSPKMGPIFP